MLYGGIAIVYTSKSDLNLLILLYIKSEYTASEFVCQYNSIDFLTTLEQRIELL